MGTNGPHELLGTAVAKIDDHDSQLNAYELAMRRLHHSAATRGYLIGQPTVHTERAPGRDNDYVCIVLVAPILHTGTDTKTAANLWDTPIDEPHTDQAG